MDQFDRQASHLEGTATHRLRDFHANFLLNTPIEERFERITRLAQAALGMPVVALTVIADDRQWFKSTIGWHIAETPVALSLCSRTIRRCETVIVEDLSADPDFRSNSLVSKAPGFRFYAGVPLQSERGTVRATLCVMDTRPRKLEANRRQILEDLGALAERELLTIDLHDAQRELLSKLSISRRKALIDPLTRVWNRRGGLTLLERAFSTDEPPERPLALCMIDIDDFKRVNDECGHRIGDRALRLVARILVSSVRPSDIVCRLGGDEFFLLLNDVDRDIAQSVLDRICCGLRDSALRTANRQNLRLGISAGIEVVEDRREANYPEVLEAADRALYRAKRSKASDNRKPVLSIAG